MFTGIIEEVGRLISRRKRGNGLIYKIKADIIVDDVKVGDSININGTCQTVTGFDRDSFEVEAIGETLSRTNLGQLQVEDRINLERSLTPSSRLGGHLVSGHIDCVGVIAGIIRREEQVDVTVNYPEEYSHYLIKKGSIAMEGISLTVVDCQTESYQVSLIPHTWESTNMVFKKIGDKINLEFDLIAKYIEKMINSRDSKGGISLEDLKEKGW